MNLIHNDIRVYVKQTGLFCAVGFTNFVVDIAVFFSAYHWAHFGDLAAQAVSYPCGAINSYLLNRRLTFSERGPFNPAEIIRFALLNVLSISISLAALYVANHTLMWNISVSKVIANGCAMCTNFIGSKWWVFRCKETVVVVRSRLDVCRHVISRIVRR